MRRFTFISFLLVLYNSAAAQWNVKAIEDSQLKNSSAVVRRYASDITIIDGDKIVVAENLVITIFDKDVLSEPHSFCILNDSIISESIESKVFDETGKRIKHAKAKFFHNGYFRKNSGSILKILSPTELSFPLTIELEYKEELKSINDFSSWNPTIDYDFSVQNASLRLSISDTSLMKYQSNRIPLPAQYVNEDGLYIFLWELINFPALKKGSSSELPIDDLPSLIISSKK